MTDYSAMSDYEINRAVAKLFPEKYSFNEEGYPYYLIPDAMAAYSGEDYSEIIFDPSYDPSDAWPIIVENKINIDHRESIKAGPVASQSGRKEVYAVDKNPLRAAMIVFLMMKEAA